MGKGIPETFGPSDIDYIKYKIDAHNSYHATQDAKLQKIINMLMILGDKTTAIVPDLKKAFTTKESYKLPKGKDPYDLKPGYAILKKPKKKTTKAVKKKK